jgi:hypothetical protein
MELYLQSLLPDWLLDRFDLGYILVIDRPRLEGYNFHSGAMYATNNRLALPQQSKTFNSSSVYFLLFSLHTLQITE